VDRAPINRGVSRFAVRYEWYYNMRSARDEGVTSIIVASPATRTATRAPSDLPRAHVPTSLPIAGATTGTRLASSAQGPAPRLRIQGAHAHKNWETTTSAKLVSNAIL